MIPHTKRASGTQRAEAARVMLCLCLLMPLDGCRCARVPPRETPDPAYKDASLPVDACVDDVLARMTLKEKVGQMAPVEKNSWSSQRFDPPDCP